jgi:integrase
MGHVATGRAERDPAADLRGALAPVPDKHFPSVTEPGELRSILKVIDGYQGTLPVRVALRLQALLFVRPGELRHMRWADVDTDAAQWRFTASKTGQPHIVPLASQALALLDELRPLTGSGALVFPSTRSGARAMSGNTVNAALRRAGIDTRTELTGHGWRAAARTILEERLGFRPEVIELQLAHAVRDPLGRAYNRTTHLEERKRMMQSWADFLDGLRADNVVAVDFRAVR